MAETTQEQTNLNNFNKVAICEQTEKSRYKFNLIFYELLRLSSTKKESKEDVLKDGVRHNYEVVGLNKAEQIIRILNEKK